MLRATLLRRSGGFVAQSRASNKAQWQVLQARGPASSVVGRRYFADEKPPVLPGSASTTRPAGTPDPPKLATSPAPAAGSTIPPAQVPKAPPAPEAVSSTAASSTGPSSPPSAVPTGPGTASTSPPPDTPAKPARRPPRRFRRFLITLLTTVALFYGGGTYYSLVSDNWHDFFTEYVPFGEDLVAYFEEREFRRRFPVSFDDRAYPQIRGEEKVTIPGRSGVSWKVASDDDKGNGRGSNLSASGPHISALSDSSSGSTKQAQIAPETATGPEKTKAVEQAKKPQAAKPEPAKPKEQPKPAAPPAASKKDLQATDATLVSTKPGAPIEHVSTQVAQEPAVQNVIQMLNDIITVVNADNASSKYSSVISKAKGDLEKVISEVGLLRSTLTKEVDDKIKAEHTKFDDASRELVRRIEGEMREQETHWQGEYEGERERLSKSYKEKLDAEIKALKEVYEQRLHNELIQQAIDLRQQFAEDVRDRVEAERDGRLGKLNELDKGVQELDKLTGEWNKVVDANLKTQHLHNALSAVKAALESDLPRPFVGELTALRELAEDDEVVRTAIASINPQSYQKGIPSNAALIDRFRRVASEVRKASLLPDNAGVASHAASAVLSNFMFKKSGLAIGDDVESILTRTETLLEEGRIEDAAREMNGLNGWAKTLSTDWLSEVRRACEVHQAVDVLEAEARLQSLLVN